MDIHYLANISGGKNLTIFLFLYIIMIINF